MISRLLSVACSRLTRTLNGPAGPVFFGGRRLRSNRGGPFRYRGGIWRRRAGVTSAAGDLTGCQPPANAESDDDCKD